MKRYRSHLILSHRDSKLIKSLNFDNHKIDLEISPDPTGTFWKSSDGCSESWHKEPKETPPSEGTLPADELIIVAENEGIAEDILSTIKGGILLAYPDFNNFPLTADLNSVEEISSELYKDEYFRNYYKQVDRVGYGCRVLKESYESAEFQYAIEKFKLSLKINSMTPHSANPKYGQMFEHYDLDKSYHTSGAFAITAAFSVVEELGLEVRSSSKNPRFLDSEKGTWNPSVLNDIEERLKKVGVTKKDTFDWVFRGDKTEVEKELKPYFGYDSEWTKLNEEVRDRTLTFPEAIHNLSYLRNFIASHKFRKLTQYISPYDIFNAQSLARNLILRSLGLWKIDPYNQTN
ncbi:hypothetical protein [Rhodohalobacter barkolensis]|uniref:Uncharacterized protein n=1 Tax=Rhodohalobacter barkolensis TaxID=2053187 RepID=A0A2N0VJW6_9BACT|nr:hypothetical protein [Rhodohalobacter barkolensis]PKD44483.1 hypothetical protein CWD77_03175 [Rhodohalobacter barkolensis]